MASPAGAAPSDSPPAGAGGAAAAAHVGLTAGNRLPTHRQWAPSLRILMEQAQQQNHRYSATSYYTNFSHPVAPVSPVSPRPVAPAPRPSFRDDAWDLSSGLVSPVMSRSASAASDRHSVVSGLTSINASNIHHVYPPPAYVAGVSASQVVSEHRAKTKRRPSSEDDDVKASKNDVQFSDAALALINQFLDHLLFTFLSTARSTSLLALRPAVSDALKGRLSKEAIASAEDELKELLGGGEEEEMNTEQNTGDSKRRWDSELVWKRTRLRVMVYTRLGEMEDEDEERFVKEGELTYGRERRFSQATGLVSWAAAIFLTSVLEYIAEQTIQISGHAAHTRVKRQSRRTAQILPDQVTVEEFDVEKVALNAMLGRLWRTWRKTLRNNVVPQSPTSRSASRMSNRDHMGTALSTRHDGLNDDGDDATSTSRRPSVAPTEIPDADHPEHVLAANIPLPIEESKRDVDEIETPGLARDPSRVTRVRTDGDMQPRQATASQRTSVMNPEAFRAIGGLPTPDGSEPRAGPEDSQKSDEEPEKDGGEPTPVQTPLIADEGKTLGPLPAEFRSYIREQKFNAADMADVKRRSLDVTSLMALERGTKPMPAADTRDITQTAEPSSDATAVGGEPMIAKDMPDTSAVEGERDFPEPEAKTAENIDKRKSLIHIKNLIDTPPEFAEQDGLERSHVQMANDEPLMEPEDPRTLVRSNSDESKASASSGATSESYTLGDKEETAPTQPPHALPQHMMNAAELDATEVVRPTTQSSASSTGIGLAKTSDYMPGTQSLGQNVETRAISGSPSKQPSRLFIGDTPALGASHPQTAPVEPSASTQHMMKRANSAQWEVIKDDTTRPVANEQSPWDASALNKRASAPGARSITLADGPQRTVAGGKSQYRQSWTASEERLDGRQKSMPLGQAVLQNKALSDQQSVPVQEHPVVQRIASLKNKDRKTEDEAAMTSASIRGPEDFDQFVQGDDMVKYTLTPENVREDHIDSHASTLSMLEGSSTSSLKKQQPQQPPPIDTRVGRSQVPREITPAAPKTSEESELERKRREQHRRSISRPAVRNKSTHRKSGLMAREPRVQTESTRDLADFLRSTGPGKDQADPRPLSVRTPSQTSLHTLRPSSVASFTSRNRGRSVSPGGERTRSMTKEVIDKENVPPVPSLPGKSTNYMQARNATGRVTSNSDLIDFIRSGPEHAGEHRISRNVAPFRNTMDSDQLKVLGDEATSADRLNLDNPYPKLPRTSTGPSRTVVSYSTPSSATTVAHPAYSTPSSATAVAHPAYSGQPQSLSNKPVADSFDGEPVKKRYRNKDPYAIDLDEEHDDLLTALPANKRKEESLADFLTNTEPPEETTPRPLSTAAVKTPTALSRPDSTTSMRSLAENAARARSMQNPGAGGPRPGYASSVRSTKSAKSAKSSKVDPTTQVASQSFSAATALPSMTPVSAGGAGGKPKGPGSGGGAGPLANASEQAEVLRFTGPDPEGPDGGAPAPVVGRHERPLSFHQQKEHTQKERRGFFGRNKSSASNNSGGNKKQQQQPPPQQQKQQQEKKQKGSTGLS